MMMTDPVMADLSGGRPDDTSHKRIVETGIGLRSCHIGEVLTHRPDVPWFELLADNHLAAGGIVHAQLDAVAAQWPLTLHCVGMNLGGTDPLDTAYLDRIRELALRSNAAWVSDHLCFTSCHGRQFHDLLPLPYTRQSLHQVAARIQTVQEHLGQPLVVENVSAYLRFKSSALTEAEFVAELVARTGCRILLDINNLYVNHINHGEDIAAYLGTLPLAAVQEIHLAGYQDQGEYLLDTHNNPVSQPVWSVYEHVISRIPDVPVLIEWDNDIPTFAVLRAEAELAEQKRQRAKVADRKDVARYERTAMA